MARARNIKPGFFANEDLVEMPFEYRLLFIGLWTLADREGRLEDRPKRIKMALFPADNVDVDQGLSELVRYGFVQRYEAGGVRVVCIPKFSEHQRPHHTEKDSELPGPNGELTETNGDETRNQTSDNSLKNNVDGGLTAKEPLDNGVLTEGSPLRNGQYPPDSLNPDSLNPDSLNPDSLNPDTGFLNPEPTTGTSPVVVGRAQAHAQPPSAAPPVDNFAEPQGLAEPPVAEPEKSTFTAEPEKPDKPPSVRRKKRDKGPVLGIDDVVAEGVEHRYAQDWMTSRSAKGVGLTRSELDANKREAASVGIPFAQAVQICAENGWRGFKAAYWRNLQHRSGFALARASPALSAQPQAADSWIRPQSLQVREQARKNLFGVVIDATG